jgi:hypothetical protein
MIAASRGRVNGLRAACHTHAGFDFDELTAALLSSWALHGAPVLAALGSVEALLAKNRVPQTDLALAACTAHLITTAYFRCEPSERDNILRLAWPAVKHVFKLTEPQVHWLCDRSYESLPRPVNRERLRLAKWVGVAPEQPASTPAPQAPVDFASILQNALMLGLHRAAWLRLAGNAVVVEASAGDWAGNLLPKLPEAISVRKPPFLLAFAQRQDVWIDFSRDNRFAESPLAKVFAPHIFFLLPVVKDQKVAGALYFDWCRAADYSLDATLPALTALRDSISARTLAA